MGLTAFVAEALDHDLPGDPRLTRIGAVLTAMPSEMKGEPVAMAATWSLLSLGTKDALKAVLRQFKSVDSSKKKRNIHDALVAFTMDLEYEDAPEYQKDAEKAWERWLGKHKKALTPKLGKWKGNPIED